MKRSAEPAPAARQECRHDTPVQVGEDLWLVDGPVVDFYRLTYPTRAVIVRLPDGGFWVWSPVPLTDALRAFVDGLGSVHHLYLAQCQRAWPDAHSDDSLRRRRARARVRQMLAWRPEKVIMAHGVWRADNGTAYLRQVFSWVGV